MGNYGYEGSTEDAKSLLWMVQVLTFPFLGRLIYLAHSQWKDVVHYEATSNHVSLPSRAPESQHTMMIALIVLTSWGVPSALAKCIRRSKTFWRFTAIIDLAVIGFTIYALRDVGQAFPTTVQQCAHMHDSEPIGKLFTYVALLANKDEEHPEYVTHTPSEMCQNFLGAWVGVIMIGYMWTIPSILGTMNLSWKNTIVALITLFFPVVLAVAFWLGFMALVAFIGHTLYKWYLRLYPYVSPPIGWIFWHLSWPLRIAWFILVKAVPSIRYTARVSHKRTLMEASSSGSHDLEKGRHVSSSGAGVHVAEIDMASVEPLHNFPIVNQITKSPTQRPDHSGDTQSSKEVLPMNSPRTKICRHGSGWHCWACGVKACSLCSVEISGSPETTQHFFCEPRCSRCYFNTMCQILPAKKSTPCSHRQNRCQTLRKPRICLSCSENCNGDEILRSLEGREREEIQHLARHNLKCGVCEQRLQPKGPRWWTCCDCNEECHSDLHPPWSKLPE